MSKYTIDFSNRYKSNRKNLSTKDAQKIDAIIKRLADGEILEPKYYDHALKGDYAGFRECHIKPNLLLIYQKQDDKLILYCLNVGSHSELFK